MKRKIVVIFILAIILKSFSFISGEWAVFLFSLVPEIYLVYIYAENKKKPFYWLSIIPFFTVFFVLMPVVSYSIRTYIVGVLFYIAIYLLVYKMSIVLIQKLRSSAISVFVFPFIWTVLLMFCNPNGIAFVMIDIGVMFFFISWAMKIIGSLGIGFIVILFNSLLAYGLYSKKRKYIIIALLIGGGILGSYLWDNVFVNKGTNNQTYRVALIQGNISETWQWSQAHPYTILEQYEKLSDLSFKEAPDMIIWPEYAVPLDISEYNVPIRNQLEKHIRKKNIPYIMGSILVDKHTKYHEDIALLFNEKGVLVDSYASVLPVAFNKYTKASEKGLNLLDNAGVVICWEEKTPEICRTLVNKGAKYMVILTNEQDIDHSWLLKYNANFSRARASENNRFVCRASNTGITQIIDPNGRQVGKLEVLRAGYLIGDIELIIDRTFYSKYGDILIKMLLLLLGAIFSFYILQNKTLRDKEAV